MHAGEKRFIPIWQLAVAGVGLVVAILSIIFIANFMTNRHRESIVEVSQDRVAGVSEVVKKYGAPQLSEAAKKSDNHLTILFFYDGYQDESKALRHVGLLQGALKNTQPFASSDVIDTRVITSAVQRCHVERKAQKILVCDKGLISEINKLNIKHFKLVVLSPLDFVPNARVVRGKNAALYLPAFKGALTDQELDVFLAHFFLHELGHTLGLRDEYAFSRNTNGNTAEGLSDNVAYQPARPNCAPNLATAKKWWSSYETSDKKIGYQAGCAGNQKYYYPQKETLMSDNPQEPDYGRISEDYLRGALDCFYGAKKSIAYLPETTAVAGRVQTCSDFRPLFPNFWSE